MRAEESDRWYKYRYFLCIRALLMIFLICAGTVADSYAAIPLRQVSLLPLWRPQAQFAGYYVALDKGMYARNGIGLKILKGGAGHSPAQALRSGGADFAVLWLATAMHQCAEGIKLVNVCQTVQRSSMMLVSRKSSGITTLEAMNGRRVGLWDGDLSLPSRALFEKHGITVREVRQSETVNLFLRGGIDVASAMWYNEYHIILNSGIDEDELNAMFICDQGMPFPEDGLYTLEKTVAADPALVDAVVRASMDGWRYAFAHPEEALDIVLKYMREANVPANRMHQKWMLARMRDLFEPGKGKGEPGMLNRGDYEAVGTIMTHYGMVHRFPDYAAFVWRPHAGK